MFGDWLEAENVKLVFDNGEDMSAAAGYTDAYGARHHRTFSAFANLFATILSGTFDEAILCWRLAPGGWHFEGNNHMKIT